MKTLIPLALIVMTKAGMIVSPATTTTTALYRKRNMLNISIEEAVRLLCKFGFMNGFFGDTSPEFQAEEVALIKSLPQSDQSAWLAGHAFNLLLHCERDDLFSRGR